MMRNLIKTKRQGIENDADRLYLEDISKSVHTANVNIHARFSGVNGHQEIQFALFRRENKLSCSSSLDCWSPQMKVSS